jgi:hypothetical protein
MRNSIRADFNLQPYLRGCELCEASHSFANFFRVACNTPHAWAMRTNFARRSIAMHSRTYYSNCNARTNS